MVRPRPTRIVASLACTRHVSLSFFVDQPLHFLYARPAKREFLLNNGCDPINRQKGR
ncbi:MAG: hypothetical protein SV375_13320 [Thermodesulfobacteriota bacterium]|nr:hypothetical protein [Thermodesulfobacteriota bacterium]